MTNQETLGIAHKKYTMSFTFKTMPDVITRQKLKAAGFIYDKGNWYKTQSDGSDFTAADLGQVIG